MKFNSFEFTAFLMIVFAVYWRLATSLKMQNFVILVSSWTFYAWWDYRFLSLILFSTFIDYTIGLKISMASCSTTRKYLLLLSIFINLLTLGFFKYFNFFIQAWIDLISNLGYEVKSVSTLNIILPVGISFYTFQTMSYTIDIYKKELRPCKDFISFASFVSFFPQLVAGPIERAANFLPQILTQRHFNYVQAVQGMRLILWGMFKKVVIADTLALSVNTIFENYQNYHGGILLLGAVYFSFQIYCDFSGYSDIAIGISKLFGFELMSNFKFPYFSRNIGEFWRRWHISLSSWFRDYVYIPLGGSRASKVKSIRNIFVIFLTSGMWHGANWTFLLWGLFHSILFLPFFIFKTNKNFQTEANSASNNLRKFGDNLRIIITFTMVTIGWIFFRSESAEDSFQYLSIMIFDFNFPNSMRSPIATILGFLVIELFLLKSERDVFVIRSNFARHLIYHVLTFFICYYLLNNNNQEEFIYFQF